uniref:uncharacterized protein LOC123460055 n=1 Tax=Jaculus jaculus TaxID=51337 RepID=UPI001E1B0885|nr:uncharacterized protein LOC123460055 [Jaculus jaculus]
MLVRTAKTSCRERDRGTERKQMPARPMPPRRPGGVAGSRPVLSVGSPDWLDQKRSQGLVWWPFLLARLRVEARSRRSRCAVRSVPRWTQDLALFCGAISTARRHSQIGRPPSAHLPRPLDVLSCPIFYKPSLFQLALKCTLSPPVLAQHPGKAVHAYKTSAGGGGEKQLLGLLGQPVYPKPNQTKGVPDSVTDPASGKQGRR